MTLKVYTDGSFAKLHKAYAFYIPELNIAYAHTCDKTNQYNELRAILSALIYCYNNNFNDIEIISDSMYSINCIQVWSKTWSFIDDIYINKLNKEMKHSLLINQIKALSYHCNVSYTHVKAHTSNIDYNSINNNIVDLLTHIEI